ncbi:MAG: ABC transporter substrate-binding protein [Thaumarchaeota archaeon]|nr:ABC transporter substrate-binding protein [Nitrososphaerota archaeon]
MQDSEGPRKKSPEELAAEQKATSEISGPLTEFLNKKVTRREAISTVGKIAVGVVVVAAAGAGAAYYLTRPTGPTVAEVVIGCPFPLSGGSSGLGQDSQAMAQIFQDQWNANGGFKGLGGAPLRLIFIDNETDPNVGRTVADTLVNTDKVSAVQNGFLSGLALTESEETEKAGVPMVTGSSSNPSLTTRGFTHFYRLWIGDDKLALKQFQYLKDELLKNNPGTTVKNIAILNDDTLFGTGAGKFYAASNNDPTYGGYNIVSNITFHGPATDVTSQVLQLKSAQPDVLFTAMSFVADAVLFQKAFKQYNLDFATMFSSAGHLNPPYQQLGSDAYFPISRLPWSPDLLVTKPWEQKWQGLFKAKTGKDMYSYPCDTYSCLNTICDAVNRAKSNDPAKINTALQSTNLGPDDVMEGYDGVQFSSTGDNTKAKTLFVQLLSDNVWHTVGPSPVAAYKAVFPQPTWADRAAGKIPSPVKV